jgi:glycosyltransferase involved in cell wall biosynthesis
MNVAFVTPRYGISVRGGAEVAARQLAEHIAVHDGWNAEVFTTCALDHITWKDVLPPGESLVNGVLVHRFRSLRGRDPEFFPLDERLRRAPGGATPRECRRWVELQGPLAPDVVNSVRDSDADIAVFYPYLYYPSVMAIGSVPMPAVLHAAAHDEPPFYLPIFRSTFRSADALVYHTAAERQLVQAHHEIADRPQIVLGLGVEPPPPVQRSGGDVLGIGDRPYLVCLGRVDAHKGSRMLARYFRSFKDRHPGTLTMAFVGPVKDPVPAEPDVVATGALSDQDKWDVLRDARLLVQPSAFESFSLAVVEAASVGRPVLVNEGCPPTLEFCRHSGGGLWFDSYRGFEAALERMLSDPDLRERLGRAGQSYVGRRFDWSVVIGRYMRFLEQVVLRPRVVTPFRDVARAS